MKKIFISIMSILILEFISFAFVAPAYSYNLDGYYWGNMPISITIYTKNAPSDFSSKVINAVNSWNNVSSSSLQFSYTINSTDTGSMDDSDGTNAFFYSYDSSLFSTEHAGAATDEQTSGSGIVGCDIAVNDDQDWDVYDITVGALHELGHCVGLDHEDAVDASEGNSIMATLALDVATNLTSDDKDGITALYPDFSQTIIDVDINSSSDSALISLSTGNLGDQEADWWILAQSSSNDFYHFDFTNGWVSGIAFTLQMALLDFSSYGISLSTLPSGTYTVYFAIDTNKDGNIRSDLGDFKYSSESVTIDTTVDLSAPTGCTASASGSTLSLSWNAVSGAEGYKLYYGFSSGNYAGSVDLGSTTSQSFSSIPDGTYYFAVTAYTSSDESDYSNVASVTVSEDVGNTDPSAAITSPSSGSTYTEGGSVTFSGTGTDTEDGTLSGSSLVWSSSIDGQIGTGASTTTSTLSEGTHTITLTVTDSGGLSDTDSISITVGAVQSTSDTVSLPKTGQTTCYDKDGNVISCTGTGQDGDTLTGIDWPDPRFTDNGNSTVTDNLTGLIWTQDGNPPGSEMTWQESLDYVAGMNAGTYENFGYTDWQLPNINELESLINAEEADSSILLNGQGFTNVTDGLYWSSTSCSDDTYEAWIVYMIYGSVTDRVKTLSSNIWPVRTGSSGSFNNADIWKTGQTTCYDESGNVISCSGTGQDGDTLTGVAWPDPRFTDNGDNTVTDNLTGLVWTQDANLPDDTMIWQEALDYVAGMNDGTYSNFGYTDWRLPNSKELFSMIDRSQSDPAIQTGHLFTNVQSDGYYNSSTIDARDVQVHHRSMVVYMYNGYMIGGYHSFPIYVWPVRTGQ